MESSLIDVVFYQFWSYFYIFFIEDTMIPSQKTIYFSIFSQQSINDVMATRTLPSVEADSNLDFFCFSCLSLPECHYLMAFLRKEGILSFDQKFELLCPEFQLFTEDDSWVIIKGNRIFHGVLEDS